MPIPEDDCVVCGRWPPAERWARRQITEWLPVGDDEPVCDECMLTFWRRLIVWDDPPAGEQHCNSFRLRVNCHSC